MGSSMRSFAYVYTRSSHLSVIGNCLVERDVLSDTLVVLVLEVLFVVVVLVLWFPIRHIFW